MERIKFLELLNQYNQSYSVVDDGNWGITVKVRTDEQIYQVIGKFLGEFAIRGEGLSGAGIEFYPLQNGNKLVIQWGENPSVKTQIYVGYMGKAF